MKFLLLLDVPVGLPDPAGNVTSSRKDDVYGLVRGVNPGGTSTHKFVGQLGHPSEDNTGLVYMRARYYDPGCGRFTSEDPGRQGANWFSYCGNDPVNRFDRTGKNAFWEVVVAGFLILLAFALFEIELPILAFICGVLAFVAVMYAIGEGIKWAMEAGETIEERRLKQNSSFIGLSTLADAVVTSLKEKGGMFAVLGWEAELEFGIMEIDSL